MSDLIPVVLDTIQQARREAKNTINQAIDQALAQGVDQLDLLQLLTGRLTDQRMAALDQLSQAYTPALAAQLALLQSGYQIDIFIRSGHFSTGGKTMDVIAILVGGGQAGDYFESRRNPYTGQYETVLTTGAMGGHTALDELASSRDGQTGHLGGKNNVGIGFVGFGHGGPGAGEYATYGWARGGRAGSYHVVRLTGALDTPVIVGAGGSGGIHSGQSGGAIILSREVM